MNIRPYSAGELCQCGVSGLTMKAIMFGNSPFEAGTKTEYGFVLIPMINTNKAFPAANDNYRIHV
jgi:hypothetical protein